MKKKVTKASLTAQPTPVPAGKKPAKPHKMPQWTKPTEEMIELFHKLVAKEPRAEQRMMFGCPVAFLNGNMFFSIHQSDLVARLPEAQRAQLLASGDARPFCPMPGMTMKEYVSLEASIVDDAKAVRAIFKAAVGYVEGLPPKKKKAKKASKKKL